MVLTSLDGRFSANLQKRSVFSSLLCLSIFPLNQHIAITGVDTNSSPSFQTIRKREEAKELAEAFRAAWDAWDKFSRDHQFRPKQLVLQEINKANKE